MIHASEAIWNTLSQIDVNEHTEKKGRFTYLSWTWAWATLMQHYPYATYEFQPNEIHGDGTVTTHCTVTIQIANDDVGRRIPGTAGFGLSHSMWLAVTDHNNRPIKNPSASDIANNKMRCLVKTLAMFGLGHYIFAGESLPQAAMTPVDDRNYYDELHEVAHQGEPMDLLEYTKSISEEAFTKAYNDAPKGYKMEFKELVKGKLSSAHRIVDQYIEDLREGIERDDKMGLDQLTEHLTPFENEFIMARLSDRERHQIAAIQTVGD